MHRAAAHSVGRALVWRLNGCWFEYIHWWSHCVVSLSGTFIGGLVLIQPMKTRPDMPNFFALEVLDVKKQTEQK